jgi:hypothetical protein
MLFGGSKSATKDSFLDFSMNVGEFEMYNGITYFFLSNVYTVYVISRAGHKIVDSLLVIVILYSSPLLVSNNNVVESTRVTTWFCVLPK